MLGHNWWWAHGLQANVPWQHLCRHRVFPRWHCHSVSCDRAKLSPCISRWYRHRESPLGGESQLTISLTELPPQPVKPLKTAGCSRPEDGVTEASWPVALGVHEGQHQMFPRLPPRKSLHLNEVAVQRPHALTLHCWWQNSAAAGGRKTLSMCSRSTISTTYKQPTGRLNGQE